MNCLKLVIIIIIIALGSACSSDIEYKEPISLFNKFKEAKGEEFQLKNLELTTPSQILIIDSLLFIKDIFEINNNTYFFVVINRYSGELYRIFGREGRGPDEFSDWTYMSRISGYSDRLGINDRRQFSFIEISIPKLLSDTSGFTLSRYNDLGINYSLVSKVDENTFIGTGMFLEGRFAVSDSNGNVTGIFESYPFEENFKDVSKRGLGMAFQSLTSVHPEQSKIAVVTFASANLDILNFEKGKLVVEKSIHSFPPIFSDESNENRWSVNFDPESRLGYRDIDVNNENIYTLYSGKMRRGGWINFHRGYRILVFGWDGKPKYQLNLDREISKLAVDSGNNVLYGLALDDSDRSYITTFDLK